MFKMAIVTVVMSFGMTMAHAAETKSCEQKCYKLCTKRMQGVKCQTACEQRRCMQPKLTVGLVRKEK